MKKKTKRIIKKKLLLRYLVLFFLVLSINFFLPRLMKADPFLFLSSDGADDIFSLNQEQIQKYYIYYGLNKPLILQYLYYIKGIFLGNLGYSISKTRPVLDVILGHIFWTIAIVLVSLLFSAIIGVILGTFSAYYKKARLGKFLYHFFIILSQIPAFLIGFGILVFSAFYISALPLAGGMTAFLKFEWSKEVFWDIIKHSILPVITLSIIRIPYFFLLIRGTMIKEIEKKYVFAERAKGFGDLYILSKHCFRNAKNPLFTGILLNITLILQGSLIVENVFEYPGIGRLLREAVFSRDYPLLQGIFLFIVTISLGITYISEIIEENIKSEDDL